MQDALWLRVFSGKDAKWQKPQVRRKDTVQSLNQH